MLSETRSVTLPPKLQVFPSSSEAPPKVPPRKESISSQLVKAELPIHLISTTNQVQKPAMVQQQIPTKLAALGKAKDKSSKAKGSHQRTHSAGTRRGRRGLKPPDVFLQQQCLWLCLSHLLLTA